MTTIKTLLLSTSLLVGQAFGQALDPAVLTKPLGTTDAWPTYSGDYSGKRYSALKQINQ
jgi:alcohol dehydrogenase (cytochrome c)